MNTRWRERAQWAAWLGLLIILFTRLTITEYVFTMLHFPVHYAAGKAPLHAPQPGPNATVAFAVVTFLLTGIAALAADRLRRRHWIALGLIGFILALGTASMLRAADHFTALVGLLDVAMALLAGWGAAVLARNQARRNLFVALVIGFLAVCCFRGFYQRTISLPETWHYYQRHKSQILRQNMWSAHSLDSKLYEARLKSMAPTGFGALSDVFAESMIPLAAAALALAFATWLAGRRDKLPRPPTKARSGARGGDAQIPFLPAVAVVAFALTFAGVAVAVLTKSKGGLAAMLFTLLVVVVAWRKRAWLARRRALVGAIVAGFFGLLIIGTVAFGLLFHTLPTKSLAFRWQYWTAAARMAVRRPLLGVGLNNFGLYYTDYKLPSAPEDVKDPHSVLVRVATEMGLPAAALWAALIAWQMGQCFPPDVEPMPATPASAAPGKTFGTGAFAAVIAVTTGWIALRYAVAVIPQLFFILLDIIYGIIAATVALIALRAMTLLDPGQRRFVAAALAVGAGGMLIYDQVNLALVTGPVAMLFWMLLGAAQSRPVSDAPGGAGPEPRRTGQIAQLAVGATLVVIAATAAFTVYLPMAQNRLRWDPRPEVRRFMQAVAASNTPGALHALHHLIRLNPRSQKWLAWQANLSRGTPRAAKSVLRLLKLNKTSARQRYRFAVHRGYGLTIVQRMDMLRRALQLNADLPKREIKRLKPAEIAQIKQALRKLRREKKPHQ